jgi:acyl dehydratase
VIEAGPELAPSPWLSIDQSVPAGSRIRGRFKVDAIEEVDGGRQATVAATVEREGADKPVCVAELLLRFVD